MLIPVDHGAIQHHTVRVPKPILTDRMAVLAEIIASSDEPGPIQTATTDNRGRRQPSTRIVFAPQMCAFPHSTPDPGGPMSRFSGASPNDQRRKPGRKQSWESLKVRLQSSRVDQRHGAGERPQRFVEEGAYVFITGRRQAALDEAVKLMRGT